MVLQDSATGLTLTITPDSSLTVFDVTYGYDSLTSYISETDAAAPVIVDAYVIPGAYEIIGNYRLNNFGERSNRNT